MIDAGSLHSFGLCRLLRLDPQGLAAELRLQDFSGEPSGVQGIRPLEAWKERLGLSVSLTQTSRNHNCEETLDAPMMGSKLLMFLRPRGVDRKSCA